MTALQDTASAKERHADLASALEAFRGSDGQECPRVAPLDPGVSGYRNSPLADKMHRLSALSSDDRAALAGLARTTRGVETGTDLLRDSDPQDGLLVVTAGFACRYKLKSNGARQITDYLLPGDYVDLKALPSEARGATAAITHTKVARISAESLASVQRDCPAIARAFDRAALVEGLILREWLMNMGRRSAEERLAHLFCELFARMDAVGLVEDNSFRLPLTQFDLGDTIGLSYVHVNRTLQSLRQKGFFIFSSKTLTILDLDGLHSLAGFDPAYLR